MKANVTRAVGRVLHPLRETVRGSYPNTCSIFPPVRSSGPRGTVTTYPTASATGVPCRKAPYGNRPTETLNAAKIEGRSLWLISLPHDVVVENDYRLPIAGEDTYEVVGQGDHGAWTLGIQVVCIKVGGDD